ncbi:hypothetical protein CW304_16770 [Bacillus sp. UFRGS-B20]|nr:hypothetical protein CW304_16770 [Bacillus sp. UFRGS-B20]
MRVCPARTPCILYPQFECFIQLPHNAQMHFPVRVLITLKYNAGFVCGTVGNHSFICLPAL